MPWNDCTRFTSAGEHKFPATETATQIIDDWGDLGFQASHRLGKEWYACLVLDTYQYSSLVAVCALPPALPAFSCGLSDTSSAASGTSTFADTLLYRHVSGYVRRWSLNESLRTFNQNFEYLIIACFSVLQMTDNFHGHVMKGRIQLELVFLSLQKRWNLSPGHSWGWWNILVDPRNLIMIVSIIVSLIVVDKIFTLLFLLVFQHNGEFTFWVATLEVFVQTTTKDSMLPLIPFAFWLLLLCWLWSSTSSTAHLTSAKLSMPTVAEKPPTSEGVEVKLEDSEPTLSV